MNKIFAIGLPKTGTSSLDEALKILGYRSLHNPLDLRFLSYREGIYKYPRDDWDAITNFGENFYPQLDLNYPNSKFILTIRDKEQWLKSSEKWFSTPPQCPWKDYQPMLEIFGCMEFNYNKFSYIYDFHFKNVKDYFLNRSDDLLILNINEDAPWEKICHFLNKPVPEVSYPNLNLSFSKETSRYGLGKNVPYWIRQLKLWKKISLR